MTIIPCEPATFLSCVCAIKKEHKPWCRFRRAATCLVPIECEHEKDVCSTCDPCTCETEAVDNRDVDKLVRNDGANLP